MLSYWEKDSLLEYDHIIVGGGITGLSTAISLREKKPGDRILVLERAVLPTGASTRNAGFACIGSATELIDYLETMTEEELVRLIILRWRGLKMLRTRLGDKAIDFQENGSYELISESHLGILDQLGRLNEILKPILGGDAYTVVSSRIPAYGFDPGYARALIENQFEGELNPGKMMRALTALAISCGVEIKTGAHVEQMEESPRDIRVMVSGGIREGPIPFSARNLVICTNAFTSELVPGLDLQPGRGQVILTEPIPGLPFRGIYHFEKGYYYFRELEGRILFGGGRQLNIEGETTTVFGPDRRILDDLKEKLGSIILPGREFQISQCWSGIMAFGSSRMPLVKRHSGKVILGVRLGGMGIALGSAIGEQLADLVLSGE